MQRRHLLALALLAAPTLAHGGSWPDRPISVMVPYLAGGPSDVFGRAVAGSMLPRLGQPGVVENRAGANGSIAAGLVARASPDGHTLLVVAGGIMTINPLLMPNLPYDPVRDFAPVTIGVQAPNVLVIPTTSPVTSLDGFLAAAKRDGMTFGTPGIGSSEHLTMAMLAQRAGVEMTHVPYPGVAQTITDLLGGTVQSGFLGLGATLSYIRAGKLRPLAVSSLERSPALPDVPAVAERYPDFVAYSWQGLVAPRGTPEPILERLHDLAREALGEATMRARLETLGFTVVASSRTAMAEAVASETERWRDVIRKAGISLG